jgi:hypothetical protein
MNKLPGLTRSVALACVLALVARLAVFFYLIAFPVLNESGDLVSPMLFQKGADYSFYLQSLAVYQGSFSDILVRFFSTFDAPLTNLYTFVTSGPVLPVLFVIFHYSAENTLPLSLATLTVGTTIVWISIYWLHQRGLPFIWLCIFAILPNPIWYQINNSVDVYLAFFTVLFLVTYLGGPANRNRVLGGLVSGTLAVLTKPNGLPLIIFMLGDIICFHSMSRRWLKIMFILGAAGLATLFFLFYMAYLVSFLENSSHFSFFYIPYLNYLGGIFDFLPAVLDLPLSWLSLIVAKLFYLVGLRPSFGVTSIELVVIRAAPGVIMLSGLLWLLLKRPRREGMFVLMFIIPPMLGATQERYLLPILPLIFFCGVAALSSVGRRLARLGGRSMPPWLIIREADAKNTKALGGSEQAADLAYHKPENSKAAEF